MIKRIIIVLSVISSLIIWSYYHPVSKPKIQKDNRYVKLNNKGEALAEWDGPWMCVEDKNTGLIWEVKSYIEDVHDEQSTFSWYDGKKGVEDTGDCFINEEYCDTLDIIKQSNQERLCGVSSWRLPTKKELKSLMKYKARPGDALIDTSYFPYARKGPYWTSNNEIPLFGIYEHYNKGALSISFLDSKVKALPYNSTCFVRLVANKHKNNNLLLWKD